MMGSGMGAYGCAVRPVESAAGETMLLWGLGQPEAHRNNALVRQAAHAFELDACGRHLSLLQSPSSMSTPGVTGAVVWDSGVVLAKFLEHAVDSQRLLLRGARAVDLGSGCGLVGCAAALLGAHVVLTDLPDRLKLLRKNVALNVDDPHVPGSARVMELVWGDDPHHELLKEPLPDFVLGSDVIYNEEAVDDLLATLNQLSGKHTTILLAGELRNDAVLECFLEAAMEDFLIACIEQDQWHPEFRSNRVALFILVKKPEKPNTD
uniref:Methyltransferase-like protein n=1 Tax=Saccharum hybrid cultivar R570 TaxID=131158 RepID=A0A059Q0T7_9POAL|nr:methyltransferase-like protein [Saccharum hybrid cultivar R570]